MGGSESAVSAPESGEALRLQRLQGEAPQPSKLLFPALCATCDICLSSTSLKENSLHTPESPLETNRASEGRTLAEAEVSAPTLSLDLVESGAD